MTARGYTPWVTARGYTAKETVIQRKRAVETHIDVPMTNNSKKGNCELIARSETSIQTMY